MTTNIGSALDGPFAYWGGHILTFLMVLSCGMVAATMFWTLLAGADWNARPPVSLQDTDASGSRTDLSILERSTPFRVIRPDPASVRADMNQLANTPETRLKLTLHGFRLDGDAETSIAVISSETQLQQHYRVGDPIEGLPDVYLVRIFADGVVIERQGENEWLPKVFKEEGGRIVSIGASETVPGLVAESAPRRPEIAAPEAETPANAQNASDFIIPESSAQRVEASVSQDELLLLADSLRFTPEPGPSGAGYVVYPTRNLDLFSRAGLQAGDVIVSVNGIDLLEAENVDAALSSISRTRRIDVSLLRGEALVDLVILSQ